MRARTRIAGDDEGCSCQGPHVVVGVLHPGEAYLPACLRPAYRAGCAAARPSRRNGTPTIADARATSRASRPAATDCRSPTVNRRVGALVRRARAVGQIVCSRARSAGARGQIVCSPARGVRGAASVERRAQRPRSPSRCRCSTRTTSGRCTGSDRLLVGSLSRYTMRALSRINIGSEQCCRNGNDKIDGADHDGRRSV